jgi:hypothetical protein
MSVSRKLGVPAAAALLAALWLAGSGCGGGGLSGEDKQKALLAGIYGTWTSKDGFTVVLMADRGVLGGARLIGGIPGEIDGRIMIKNPAKDSKWMPGVYKVVGRRVLARSSTEEAWAITLTCDLGAGRLYLPGPDGKPEELIRSARAEGVKLEESAPDLGY